MSIETERIYKITEDNFYGVTQGTRPIVDDEGNITGQVQNPVATIRYDNRLITVEPHQVEFVEDSESETKVGWHVGEGNSEDIDPRIDMFSENLDEHVPTSDDIITGAIKHYASGMISSKVGCEFNHLGKGFKEIRIVWRDNN